MLGQGHRKAGVILALEVPMRTHLVALLVLSACVAEVPGEYSDFASTQADLTASERRARAAQIRDAANAAGMTQGWMLAGIAQAETGLAHCWSEATWACQGPNSPDCGGGPVIAGAGDGPCSLQQGGLGLFQFDGGTFSQTLARDGNEILRIDGNVTRAVWFVTNMVKNSSFISGVSTDAQAIDWMNGVRIDNSRWDAWISTVVRHYNGCRMSSSCWAGRYASYRDKTRDVYNEMGDAFWSMSGDAPPTPPTPPTGPSIRDIANRGACSTAGAEGLSAQLAEAQRCMNPGAFVRFAPHPGITLTSDRVHPYAQASARDALHRAAASRPLSVNSAFRTVADQYVLYHSGACGLAATPGRSNHQSGRAVDVSNHASVRSTLEAQGCRWLGSRDPVHFDCPGTDQRDNSVRAFQRLWNVNNPRDTIDEDGIYGNQTGSRLAMAPAGGFTRGVCDEPSVPVVPPAGTSQMRGVAFLDGDIDSRVGGVTVRVIETGESTVSASSDGMWSFTVADGTYTLEASASGFATTRQSCIVAGDVWCSIEMTRGVESSDGRAAGQLFVDNGMGTGAAITTGQVVVTETGLRATPDASGRFVMTLPAGTYTLVGSAEGYTSVTRSCSVNAGSESTCSLGLVAEATAQELVGVVFTQGDIFTRVINVRVRVLETDAETTSREGDGLFRFNVAPGRYTVEVSGPGIETALRVCDVESDTTWCSVGVVRNGDDSFGVGFEETNDEGVVADLDDLERADTASITGSACSASAGSNGAPAPWILVLTFLGAAVLRRRR